MRSLLFVPGNNPRFLEKARSAPCDAVCIDLEDSVPPAEKAAARRAAAAAVSEPHAAAVCVRTNPPGPGGAASDAEAVARPGLAGVVVPKVESPGQVLEVERALEAAEAASGAPRAWIAPSVESARGVADCRAIASCSGRVRAVVFGVFDLMTDMGMEHDPSQAGAVHARARVPLEARAAGVPAVDSIWQDVRDGEGLRADCAAGRAMGYAGKCVIHPGQIGAVHEAFAPRGEEVEWARRVREAYEAAAAGGRGAVEVGGRMVDEAHYRRALALLGEGRPAAP